MRRVNKTARLEAQYRRVDCFLKVVPHQRQLTDSMLQKIAQRMEMDVDQLKLKVALAIVLNKQSE